MPRFLMASMSCLVFAACQTQLGDGTAPAQSDSVEVISDRVTTLSDGTRQVEYPGSASDYTIVHNLNDTFSITKPDGSTDIVADIDGIWFRDEAKWHPIDAVASPAIVTGITDGDDRIRGTNEDDVIDGLGGNDVVVGSAGSDTIYLGDGNDQIDYIGFAADYAFVRDAEGTVQVTKPNGGIDSLIGVEGVWFIDEAQWYAVEAITASMEVTPATDGNDIISGTSGDDLINGLGGEDVVYESAGNDIINLGDGYDQMDFKGALADYIFTQNDDGSLMVTKPDGGVDILTGVDGFWFTQGETWISAEDFIPNAS